MDELAREVSSVFKIRPGVFYTPGESNSKHKLGASGKFVGRLSTLRTGLNECGVFLNRFQQPEPIIGEAGTIPFFKFSICSQSVNFSNKIV